MNVLVTGGTGYIGSHTSIELINSGYNPIIIDNFSNSKSTVINRLQEISAKNISWYECDINDCTLISEIIQKHSIEAVIHFAGLKSAVDSISNPVEYYSNNIAGTLSVLRAMQFNDVKRLIFSSSATVYGDASYNPVPEHASLLPINPYGKSKLFIEEILRDLGLSDTQWGIAILRYFNPVGAHHSGLIGEDPRGNPTNLMPIIGKVASGELSSLNVFGKDYPTSDGSGVRDYIHINDLSRGHLAALNFVNKKSGVEVFNLGTGQGTSVLQLIAAYEKASGHKIPFEIVDRRPGDICVSFADASKANSLLKWRTEHDVFDMCRDSWNWVSNNLRDSKK
jgi:UDP-glucose 4-epimerase